jgi:hypothetical protein
MLAPTESARGASALAVPAEAALLLSTGEADGRGNLAGCGATRLGSTIVVTARHCAEGGASYVTVHAGTSRRALRPVGRGRRWIGHGRAPSREALYGNDLAFLVTAEPLPADIPIGAAAAATEGDDAIVLAWPSVTDPPEYVLTAFARKLGRGPFGLRRPDGLPAVRAGERFLVEPLVSSGDSGTALLDSAGAVLGVVSRGLRASDLAPQPPEAAAAYVGAVWAGLEPFCARWRGAPADRLIGDVIDWRLADDQRADPVGPADHAAVGEVDALCP